MQKVFDWETGNAYKPVTEEFVRFPTSMMMDELLGTCSSRQSINFVCFRPF